MRKSFTLIFTAFILISGSGVFAQVTFSGEMRPRSEYRHGFSTLIAPEQEAAFFISQRSRLNLEYAGQDVKVFVSFQDIRVWGEVPQLNRSDLNSSIHEAWAEIGLGEQFALKLGRQEVIYDNARIFGNVDWAQQARSHDLALLKWKPSEPASLHAGFAFNQQSERVFGTVYDLDNYKTLQYLWFNYRLANTALSFLFLNNGMQFQPDKTVFSQTTGLRATRSANLFDFSGSFYYQGGKDAQNRRLNAWYLSAEALYPFHENWTARAGFEWLSGTDETDMATPGFDENHSFTPFYGTNHAFNGHMDYFYVGNHLNDVGLRNPYIGLNYQQNRFSLGATAHLFYADGNIMEAGDPGSTMDAFLGAELDLMAGFNLNKTISFMAGYSQMFATTSMEAIKGGSSNEVNNWAWIMLNVKPEFFRN